MAKKKEKGIGKSKVISFGITLLLMATGLYYIGLNYDYAIEFDFAKKWAESIGQSLYYSKMTGKSPAVVLILTSPNDYHYVKRVERLDNGIKIFLIKAF